jgi:RimJ/RimL family protein N-acetyltransferase
MRLEFSQTESNRLLLRRFALSDLDSFVAYRSDEGVAQYQSWEDYTNQDGEEFLSVMASQDFNVPGTWFQIALQEKSSGALIGDLAVHTLEPDGAQVEIGFTLARSFQGKGFASEAIARLLDLLFLELNKHRVIAICDAQNTSAASLLERLHFRREAHMIQNIWFKGAWGDEFQFAMLKDEWESISDQSQT